MNSFSMNNLSIKDQEIFKLIFEKITINHLLNARGKIHENLTIEGKDYKFVHREEDKYALIEMSEAEQVVYKVKLDLLGETFAIYIG